jgi:hypothetical protein
MDVTFKYLESSAWVTYGRIVTPLSFGDTLKNETMSAFAIRLYFKGSIEIAKPELVPGTICRIDFGTKQYDYVIVDGGKIDNKSGVDYCYHSYSIQELLAYTREIFIQNAYFTQNEYTLSEFFTRLLALCDKDKTIVLDTSGDYSVLSNNWDGAEYQVASNSLLDNLIKIGQRYRVRIKARINASFNLELYFISLEGNIELTSINGLYLSKDNQYQGANYASRAHSLVNNLTNGDMSWFPHQDASKGLRATPENDTLTIEPGSAVVKLNHKIKNANKVKIRGFGAIITNSETQWPGYVGSDYRVFDSDGNRIYPDSGLYVSIDENASNVLSYPEVDILPYDNWKQLDPDATGGQPQHQENTLYFKQEENKIYNIKVCDGDSADYGADYYAYVEVWYGGALISTDYIYPLLKWHRNKYIVNASFYVDALVSAENGINSKRTAIYNQEDNIVNANSLVKNLNTYIESMKNEEESPSYRFNSIDDLPSIGNKLNGKVISQIMANAYYDKIDATFSLSDDLVKKSEYLSADSGLNLPKIDIDKAFDRFKNYKTKIWFCQNNAEATAMVSLYGEDSIYKSATYIERVLNSIKNGRTNPPVSFAYAELKLGDVYTSITPALISAGNSLLVIFKTINNIIIGYAKDETLGTDYADIRYYPVSFFDGSKEQYLRIRFKTFSTDSNNYPAITSTQFYSSSGLIADIYDSLYYHDPNEVINIIYQLEAKATLKSGFVKKAYWDESDLLADFYSNEDRYTRVFTMYSESTGSSIAIFGENVAINNVAITYLGNGVGKVDIEIPAGSIPSGFGIPAEQNNSYVVVKRRNITTFEYEDLLKTKCEVTGSGTYYITYYVAFTR